MYKKTTGIILKGKKIREADEILTIYTNNLGKITAIAKGIKRIFSKKAGHLEPLMISYLELINNKNNAYLIKEAKTLNNFKKIRNNFSKTIIACYLVELVDKTTSYEENNFFIFKLLKDFLNILENINKNQLPNIIYAFKIKLIKIIGFWPELNFCLSCGNKKLTKNLFFNFSEGGIFCSNCQPCKNALKIEKKNIETIKKLEKLNLDESLDLLSEDIKKIINLVDFYLKFILEHELQSKKVIRKIKEEVY